ncbi:hypothetical protein [Paenibacillus herberti]|uniref:Uncharacterized protein n=1 Tax=Paenibacillus herberti TaxID=1619309 RepID=A0A229P0V5_9BACL|nr:hypothetical protein [Paenibacillus herberti]OXM15747.1 hypothetical protein CGZ75_03200 [Paenibacillus herberti]
MSEKDGSVFKKILMANAVFINSCLSLISDDHPRVKLYRFLINSTYIIIPSFLFGLVFYISIIVIFNFINERISVSISSLYSMILFVFSFLFSILSLNYHNKKFNLPRELFILVTILKKSKLILRTFKAMGFIIFISLLFSFLWMVPIYQYKEITTDITGILIIVIFISFFLTFSIFSYSTLNDDERTFRQLVLWSVILLIMFVFTIFQIKLYLNSTINEQIVIAFVFTIIGFIFSLISVLDKAVSLIRSESQKYEDYFSEYIELVSDNYITITSLNKKKQELILLIQRQHELWNTGRKMIVINAYLYSAVVSVSLFFFYNFLTDGKFEELFHYLVEYIMRFTGIPSESFKRMAIPTLAVGFCIWVLIKLTKDFQTVQFIEKLERIAMFISTFSVLIMIFANLTTVFKHLVEPMMLLNGWLVGGIIFSIMLIKSVVWVYKKVHS